MAHPWIADRALAFDSSGIRKVFELAAKMRDPINLSIGQPDFDVPEQARAAAMSAVQSRKNAYSITQGIAPLRERLQKQVEGELGHADRQLFITSGTSGGLVLTMMTLVNPGDEVLIFDPYFVAYEPLIKMVGGVPVVVDTAPDLRIDVDKVRKMLTPRTKVILLNSPTNPTGKVATEAEVEGLARLAAERNIALVSDEIYRLFCYDAPFVSPARFNPHTIVIDGFSKSHGMTGWRVGWIHGPSAVIEQMLKMQQFTFVCAPQPLQWGALTALDTDMSPQIAAYRGKRDLIYDGLREHYQVAKPGGAFYIFPRIPSGPAAPWRNAAEFVEQAIERELLIIPGHIFSRHADHFRISYAADERTLTRGIAVLQELAKVAGG
ncbi:MAG: aminotransferase class I/II-fold pyridoxal phosphate-dependent enzyme [Pirellulales bacterium]|nr:aminotransferase class I/II-fold pyridoxal phosphate-dependent enzyme [Pirellulales bacterium]